MFNGFIEESEVINSVDTGYNYIPAYFYNDKNKLYYLVLINPNNKKHKIALMKNKLDLFFFKKHSYLKKQIALTEDSCPEGLCFGKDEENQNSIYCPNFHPILNNLHLDIKTNNNLVNKINIEFSSYNNFLRFNEISELNFFNKNFFKFVVMDLFFKKTSPELDNYKNLILYLTNIRDHLSVFLNLFKYSSESFLFNKIFKLQNELDNFLTNIKPNNISKHTASIKNFCKSFLNENSIANFLDNKAFKKQVSSSCVITKKDAFYNSSSGVILRASGIDLDFMPYKNRRNIVGKIGGTWDRFNIRFIEIKILLSEVLLLLDSLSCFKLPSIDKKEIVSSKHYYQTENANGLFLTYMEYDAEKESIFIKINNPSINNLNLIEYALKSKNKDFYYFMISLNIKNQELNVNKPLLLKHPLDALDFIYE